MFLEILFLYFLAEYRLSKASAKYSAASASCQSRWLLRSIAATVNEVPAAAQMQAVQVFDLANFLGSRVMNFMLIPYSHAKLDPIP
jgi:hypothetical protein